MIAYRRAAIIGGAALLLGAGGYVALGNPAAAPADADGAVASVVAERRDLELTAEAWGQVEPIRTVEVKSKASGEVLEVHVETGDRVEPGALLAEIDPRDVQNTLDQAAADLESARVQLSTTEAHRARMEELRAGSAVTQQEYESAVQAAAAARAQVVRAETNLQLAQDRRNDVTIRAPTGGTIIVRDVEPGQIIASATSNVSGGTTLFTMADLSQMQVRALIDETDIGKIAPGQQARVTVEAYPSRAFVGEVQKIEPQAVVDQNVTTFPVLVRLANPEGLLKPGMNADVSVEIATRTDVVAVPNSTIASLPDAASAAAAFGLDPETALSSVRPAGSGAAPPAERAAFVFVEEPGGPAARAVTLGVSDWEYTEVLTGLEAGEKVMQVSAAQLRQQEHTVESLRQPAGNPLGGVPPAGGRRGG